MKQGSNQRRSRGRGNGGRRSNRNQTYDSNGPDVKVRGTAQQVLDKYLQLARDAQSGGDRIKAEAYLQFAEHYYRIVNVDKDGQDSAERRGGDQHAEGQDASGGEDAVPAEQKPARGRRRPSGSSGGNKNEATLAAEAAAANEASDKAKTEDSEAEETAVSA